MGTNEKPLPRIALPETPWPEFCCAIIRDAHGRYLMEKRPPTPHNAARRFTCFGGGRNNDEHPEACLARELHEELGMSPGTLAFDFAVRLISELPDRTREIAWFFVAASPLPNVQLQLEEDVEAVWMPFDETQREPVSSWHRLAIASHAQQLVIARSDH